MNPDLPNDPRAELEQRLTALLLGELIDAEAAELRKEMAGDPELTRLHDQLQRTLPLVRETVATPAGPAAAQPQPLRLSDERREKLLAHFKTLPLPALPVTPQRNRRPRDLKWVVPMSLAAALVALLGVAGLMLPSFSNSRRSFMAVEDRRGRYTIDSEAIPANQLRGWISTSKEPVEAPKLTGTPPESSALNSTQPAAKPLSDNQKRDGSASPSDARRELVRITLPAAGRADEEDKERLVSLNYFVDGGRFLKGAESIPKTIVGAQETPAVVEFLGYDDPGAFVPQAQIGGGNWTPMTANLPVPRFRFLEPKLAGTVTKLSNGSLDFVSSNTDSGGTLGGEVVRSGRELARIALPAGGRADEENKERLATRTYEVDPKALRKGSESTWMDTASIGGMGIGTGGGGGAGRADQILTQLQPPVQSEARLAEIGQKNVQSIYPSFFPSEQEKRDVRDPTSGAPLSTINGSSPIYNFSGTKIGSARSMVLSNSAEMIAPASDLGLSFLSEQTSRKPVTFDSLDARKQGSAKPDEIGIALPAPTTPAPIAAYNFAPSGGAMAGQGGGAALAGRRIAGGDGVNFSAPALRPALPDPGLNPTTFDVGARSNIEATPSFLGRFASDVSKTREPAAPASPPVRSLGGGDKSASTLTVSETVALGAGQARQVNPERPNEIQVSQLQTKDQPTEEVVKLLNDGFVTIDPATGAAIPAPPREPSNLQAGDMRTEGIASDFRTRQEVAKTSQISEPASRTPAQVRGPVEVQNREILLKEPDGIGVATAGINALRDPLNLQVKKLEQLKEKVNKLRSELLVTGVADSPGYISTLEPETLRRLEANRIDAKGQYDQLNTVLTNLLAESRPALRKSIMTAYPDPQLSNLLEQQDRAEQKLGALTKDFGAEHPDAQRTSALLATVSNQVDNRIDGILKGLTIRVHARKANLEALDDQIKNTKESDSEAFKRTRPYFEAKAELERAQKELGVASADTTPPKPAAPAPIPQPEVLARDNPFSTFSLNVSDVSFKLAAASLEKGQMPDPASVRSEEFINAFDYRDPEAPPGVPVAFAWERARYPFAHNRDLLRFSLKTAAAGRPAGSALNLVLVLDNSGSMERADRVRILREALRVLAGELHAEDRFSVITFARTPRLVADAVSGSRAAEIAQQLAGLTPEGGTNLEEALNLAYQTALRHYLAGGMNRVVLLTDGAANLGSVEPDTLKARVEAHRKQGVALDCFGIGWEGFNDDLLEVLSRNGDGRYGFINTPEEAETEFSGQLAGALKVAASDVKVQVEFNPRRVTSWRQIGYAKHQLTQEQFRDNKVDAAEIAAQEAGNALYTVETNPNGDGPLATVRVRFKIPGTADYREHEWTVPFNGSGAPLEQASPALRLAATTSAFSEWLVSSPFAGEVTPDRLLGYLGGVPEVYGADARPKKLEWMIRQAKSVAGR